MKQLIFITLLVSHSLCYGQSTTDNNFLFSNYLKSQNAGLKYKLTKQQPNPDYKSSLNPETFKLAYTTGYIIFIDEPRFKKDVPAYDNLIKALRNAGYFIYHVTNKDYLSFAIPSTFLDKNSNLLDLFDGDYSDVYLKYLMDWWENRSDIQQIIKINNELITKMNEQGNLDETLTKTIDSLTNQIAQLKKDISDIEIKTAIVESDINPTFAYDASKSNTDIRIPSLLKIFADKKIPYSIGDDFFIKALEKLAKQGTLVNVGGRDWVIKGSVSTPYVHPDLAKAIEEINRDEADALKKMGFPNGLKITSAARTPYNQAIQIATRPVAAGMFGSGHLCGISVDFDNEPAITANYDAFAKLMSKHGLFCDPALKPGAKNSQGKSMADPKHVYLGAGFSRSPNFDKAFANDLMTQCLGAYQDAMTNERSVQNAKSGELASENKTLNNIIANMDTHLKDVQGRLDKLKTEKDNLDKQKNDKQKGLESKTQERAVRELQKRLKSEGKSVSDREIRDRLGKSETPKDGYWERYGEFHSSGRGWECNGSRYENSRGESWGSMECHSTGSETKGIERLP